MNDAITPLDSPPGETEPPISFGSPVQQALLFSRKALSNYALRAFIQAALTVWAVLTFTFVLVRMLPGSPVDVYIDRQMQVNSMSYEQALARASVMFNTDFQRPILEQYLSYLNGMLHFNLGQSITSPGTSVASIIAAVLPWTLFSLGLGLLLSFIFGLVIGMLMAYWRNTLFDGLLTVITSFFWQRPELPDGYFDGVLFRRAAGRI